MLRKQVIVNFHIPMQIHDICKKISILHFCLQGNKMAITFLLNNGKYGSLILTLDFYHHKYYLDIILDIIEK